MGSFAWRIVVLFNPFSLKEKFVLGIWLWIALVQVHSYWATMCFFPYRKEGDFRGKKTCFFLLCLQHKSVAAPKALCKGWCFFQMFSTSLGRTDQCHWCDSALTVFVAAFAFDAVTNHLHSCRNSLHIQPTASNCLEKNCWSWAWKPWEKNNPKLCTERLISCDSKKKEQNKGFQCHPGLSTRRHWSWRMSCLSFLPSVPPRLEWGEY